MQTIYYERIAHLPALMNSGAQVKCFYLPSKSVVILIERKGPFDNDAATFTEDPEALSEAQEVAAGRAPLSDGIEYKNIKELNIDEYLLTSLLDDARARDVLEERVTKGVEQLKGFLNG